MTTSHIPRSTRIAHALAAAGLSLCMTLAALGSIGLLADSQHASVLAQAAATQQAQAAVQAAAPRG